MQRAGPLPILLLLLLCVACGWCYWEHNLYNASVMCVGLGGACTEERESCDMATQAFMGYCENHASCCVTREGLCTLHLHGFCCNSTQECLDIHNYTLGSLECDEQRRCCLPRSVARQRNAGLRRRGRGRSRPRL